MNNEDIIAKKTQTGGLIAWFAGNHVAANLLMIFMLVCGAIALMGIKVEIFPKVSIDIIRVTVPYLGASPAEVEEGVCVRVEEAIAGVDGVKRVTSVAAEGSGTIVAEVEDYADIQAVLDDIKAEVDRIETFPQETEKPIITKLDNRTQVMTLSVFGDVPEKTIKNLAEQIREQLTAKPNISMVEMAGLRRFEISIEVSEESLQRYNLSFDDLSGIISGSSLDLPGGSVKTEGGEILVRTKGQKYTGDDFADVVVLTDNDGTQVRLNDVATIIDGFEDSDIASRFNGKPSAMINVFRIGEQGAIDITDTIKEYVDELRPQLPAGVNVALWGDFSELLKGRINLLKRNGIIGISLVFICLLLFLDARLSFWTTIGIPISFMGAFFLLPICDVSINMISLFAFIVSLGIVVDDAIIVGENIFAYRQRGHNHLEAAILGAREMAAPVTMAILTTVAAFSPLIFVDGIMGKFIRVIPIVVIAVLSFSLMEAFFILPAHLSGSETRKQKGPVARIQDLFRRRMEWFIHKPFAGLLQKAFRYRYVTLAVGIALLVTTVGYIAGGHIKFRFFDEMDADNMFATLTMPQGTTREETEKTIRFIEDKAFELRDAVLKESLSDKPVIKNVATYIGGQPFSRESSGPHGRGISTTGGGHMAEVNVELISGEERGIASKVLASRWRESVGEISGVSSLTFKSTLFGLGDAINVELAHRDFDTLILAANKLKVNLAEYTGVTEISDSFEPGKIELKLDITEQGRMLGLTLEDLARQVRQGFYGTEVQRIQRGRDDVRVMLRYPEAKRQNLDDIRNMRIRLADDVEVPFSEVAQALEGRGYANINRADQRRIVGVTADVDEKISDTDKVNKDLEALVLPKLQEQFPGLSYTFQGEKKEQGETMGSLALDFIVALIAIFGLLAVQFRSYVQPLIIMSAIPFGLIGAVIGHVLLGYNLTFLSMFGIVALTGVVVNDSLILIDLINRMRRYDPSQPLLTLVLECTQRRFRPIILTTLTTFIGLMPMIMEKSLQAKFLIPMAISLGFGVLFATTITLLLIPTLYLALEDVKRLLAIKTKTETF